MLLKTQIARFPYSAYNTKMNSMRIFGGNSAKDFIPYHVQLCVFNATSNITMVCGATLITSNHVLTAQHCIEGHIPSLTDVKVGFYEYGKNFWNIVQVLDRIQSYRANFDIRWPKNI